MSCTCQNCGRKFKVDLNIDDNLWETIRKGKNLLCASCIMEEIEKLNEYEAFQLIKI